MRKSIGVIASGLVAASTAAHASGFELRESSASAMGTSYAGAAATDNDPSYMFYNPAALGGVKDWDASATLTGLILGSNGNFSGTTPAGTPSGGLPNPHDFIGDALVPAMALRYRLNDRWAVGLSLSVPWGEVTHYPDDWTGRYYALSTSLTAYNAQPIVSYQVLPNLTLAAGAQIQYVHSRLTQAIDFGTLGAVNGIPGAVPGAADGFADLHGHSWGAGYVLGAMWQPSPELSLGVSYRSEVQQALKGSESFIYDDAGIAATINALTGVFTAGGGRTDLPTPASVTAGARWNIADRWTALAGLEYTNWSSLRELAISPDNPANPASFTSLNWKDTWFGSLGVEYRPDDSWTLRAGTAYDMAASQPDTLEPRIPDADRYWVSAGVGYHWNENADLNFGVAHLFAPETTIDQQITGPGNASRGELAGTSNVKGTLISAQITLR
jgi:long-chain fatty acid transport protein